ncbi:MAG: molybdate ABC transporter substrate-binding protein [Nitrospinota bacterium]
MLRAYFLLCLSLLMLASAPRGAAAGLIVSAAISLKESFQRIAREFEKAHRQYQVVLNFASSGYLQRQIEQGAPVDVFASAAVRQMDALEKAKFLHPGTRRIFATNRIVLVRPKGGALVTSFSALGGGFQGRLVIGNPVHVPVGFYAKQALESLGYWKGLQPDLILADHVRQVLDYVARGEVDAGIVYYTDWIQAKDAVEVVGEPPSESHKPIEYPIAVIAGTRFLQGAASFVRFILGPKSQSILARAGFGSPP